MTLKKTERQSGGEWAKIVECPFCGTEINGGSAFRYHMPCEGVEQ